MVLACAAAVSGCGGGSKPERRTKTIALAPNTVEIAPPHGLSGAGRSTFVAGEVVAGESGCLACHVIDGDGNAGPGPPLTRVGDRMTPKRIAAELRNPKAPMPSFESLASQDRRGFDELVDFLSQLR